MLVDQMPFMYVVLLTLFVVGVSTFVIYKFDNVRAVLFYPFLYLWSIIARLGAIFVKRPTQTVLQTLPHTLPTTPTSSPFNDFLRNEEEYYRRLAQFVRLYQQPFERKLANASKSEETENQQFYDVCLEFVRKCCELQIESKHLLDSISTLKQGATFEDKLVAALDKFVTTSLNKYVSYLDFYIRNKGTFVTLERDHLAEMEILDRHGMRFEEMISQPPQRFKWYVHALQQMRNQFNSLQDVVDKAQKLLDDHKEELDQIFQIDKIRELSKKLNLPNLGKISFSANDDPKISQFVHEGKLALLPTNKEYDAYLFDDLFITSSTVMNRPRNTLYHINSGYFKVFDLEERKSFKLQISEDEDRVFVAATPEEKKTWVEKFEKVLSVQIFEPEKVQQEMNEVKYQKGDHPQDYYLEKLDSLYKKRHLWECFEQPDTKDNIEFSDNNEVRLATLDKLIQRLLHPSMRDQTFLFTFMLTYRSFITPDALLEKIINRYNTPPPKNCSVEEWKKFKIDFLFPVRLRVCEVLKFWLEQHGYDFRPSFNVKRAEAKEFQNKLSKFIEDDLKKTSKMRMIVEQLAVSLQRIVNKRDTVNLQKYANLHKGIRMLATSRKYLTSFVSKLPKPKLPFKIKKSVAEKSLLTTDASLAKKAHTMDITEWPSIEIARQLTLVEFELFESIQPRECLNQAWNTKNQKKQAPNIFEMITRTNQVVNWVTYEIIKFEKVAQRQKAIQKFIKVARECKKLNNFNALLEIIGGLNSIAVHRLKKSWAGVSQKLLQEFHELEEFVSHKKNFKNMRTALHEVHPPAIPYVGLYLTDLTFIDEANDAKIGDKINFYRCRKIARLIRELQTFQRVPYQLAVVAELQNKLKNMNVMNEDKLTALSKKRE